MNIVEPFLHGSRLTVPLDTSQKDMLTFSDLFNLQQWDELTATLRFAPLAPWNKFLSDAPRQLIVVRFEYSSVLSVMKRIVLGEKASHLAYSDAYKEGCSEKPDFAERLNYLLEQGFRIVREVCINFQHGDEITLFQFNSHIFDFYHPREVTVLMDEWRGFAGTDNGKRVLVNDACWTHKTSHSVHYLKPSQRVYCDAHNYQKMYLGGKKYISVIIRTEKMRMTKSLTVDECLRRTLNILKLVQNSTKLQTKFLSMDIGKYGSGTQKDNETDYNPFVRRIYGSDASVDTWEKTFESVTIVREPGYIASLQKVLAAEARCVVVVGGGSFQKHALQLHSTASKAKGRRPCVYILRSCSKNIEVDKR